MSRLLITNGRVIDPRQQLDRVANLLIDDGRIAGIDGEPRGDERTLDATGRIVAPGLIDTSVQLREPGHEEDETILTGSAAALAGGFTSIACLPNTDPPIDSQGSVEFVRHQAERAGGCNVFVLAAVSKGRQGEELAEMGSLMAAGAIGFTDATAPIHNAELMRRALEYCQMFNCPILNHPEVPDLSRGGIMHEGLVSTILGLAGMPAEAENVMVSRDLHLVEATGGRLHLLNVSSAGSVELIRRAKSRGVQVTAGIAAANFTLTDESLRTFDARYKLNPPLRSLDHLEACIAGLADGTIDVITSGHAPRAAEKKMEVLDLAPFGMSSLETTLGLVVKKLIEPGHLDWIGALAKLTSNPARVLGLDNKGTLTAGADADVVVIDPQVEWTVDPRRFCSKSGNTPLADWRLRGKVETVIVAGTIKRMKEEGGTRKAERGRRNEEG